MYESCAREFFRGWANLDSQGPQAAENVRFRNFEADLQRGELRKSGRRVKLQPQPFQVLALLARRPGELVTREEIRHELWKGDTFVDFEQGLNFLHSSYSHSPG
jgi:DNA-binding response OmpR family regulator